MINLKQFDVWFVTGSQHLYGPATLEKVVEHAQEIAQGLSGAAFGKGERAVNHLIIQADQGKQRISKQVYGHFAEHLGRCIYEGIWVGEESPIPHLRAQFQRQYDLQDCLWS